MFVLYARRNYEAFVEQYRDLTAVLKATDLLLTQGHSVAIDVVADKPEQPETTLPPEDHPLIGQQVTITKGQHQGKSGIVRDVRPSKYRDGLCAFVEHKGLTMYANVAHCQQLAMANAAIAPKPPAASIRKPIARKANGSVPW